MGNLAIWHLTLNRIREMMREPSFVFWTFVFPLLVIVTLGIAFNTRSDAQYVVDFQVGKPAEAWLSRLQPESNLQLQLFDEFSCKLRLRNNDSDAYVVVPSEHEVEYHFDSDSDSAQLAVQAVNQLIQEAAGRQDPIKSQIMPSQRGLRYTDFLVPGILGLNLLAAGMWGIGFVVVDMRIRKVLRLYSATPVRRWEFLLAIMVSRLVLIFPQTLLLVVLSQWLFGLTLNGSLWASGFILTLGGMQFGSIGLLLSSRVRTVETASGLINVVSFPLWAFCGVFFSYERFPASLQPAIQFLPLTPLLDALRAVMVRGESLATQMPEVGLMVLWTVVSLVTACYLLRWSDS
ncbi:MAG: ABC transporter permease [Planctomycetales bacterium]|nr:ABC transporter permease [Planctomycetales bacterium]